MRCYHLAFGFGCLLCISNCNTAVADIIYDLIPFTVDGTTVSGTVITDGALGGISDVHPHVVTWNFKFSSGATSRSYESSQGGSFVRGSFTATETALLFGINDVGIGLGFAMGIVENGNVATIAGYSQPAFSGVRNRDGYDQYFSYDQQIGAYTDPLTIIATARSSAVPEPKYGHVIVLSGFFACAGATWLRRSRSLFPPRRQLSAFIAYPGRDCGTPHMLLR